MTDHKFQKFFSQEYIAFNPKALVPNKISHNRLTNAIANVRNAEGSGVYHKAENYWYRDTGMFTIYGHHNQFYT